MLPVAGAGISSSPGNTDLGHPAPCATDPPPQPPPHPADHLPADVLERIDAARRQLDGLPEMDYEATMAAKLGIARSVFDEQGQETLEVGAGGWCRWSGRPHRAEELAGNWQVLSKPGPQARRPCAHGVRGVVPHRPSC